jgi:cellulose synthase/poly-beta-1,6-N-acetylglucosamine synthase-like glycosyltransferase
MNFDSTWYSVLNVLEYFFWFKSRLHYHARRGAIPLGGNTVFFDRALLSRVGGWDERNLTEDADIGLRLSGTGEKIRVVYDDRYVTREETPPTLGGSSSSARAGAKGSCRPCARHYERDRNHGRDSRVHRPHCRDNSHVQREGQHTPHHGRRAVSGSRRRPAHRR